MNRSNARLASGLGLGHPDIVQHALGLALLALGQVVEHVGGLVHPAALFAGFGKHLAATPPRNPRAPSPTASLGASARPRAFRSKSSSRQLCSLSRGPSLHRRPAPYDPLAWRADHHQDALPLAFQACLEMDAIGPDVGVALRRQIALLPRGVFVDPRRFLAEISLMMLSLDTAYRSFGGEVEASSTPTICRLSEFRRHQLSAIESLIVWTFDANTVLPVA